MCNVGVDLNSTKQFETKNQKLHRLQEGVTFGDGDEYTPAEYLKMASETALRYEENHFSYRKMTLDSLEQEYWNL